MTTISTRSPNLTWQGPAIALAALFLVYLPALADLAADWWNDPNYSHGFLIPLISGYLLFKDRTSLRRAIEQRGRPGLGAVITLTGAMGMYILGNGAAEYFTVRLSFVLALTSLAWYFLGSPFLKRAWFPLLFLFFMIPWPYVIYYAATFPLQLLATKVSMVALNIVGVSAVRDGNIIHLPGMSLEVAEACSGVRSMISLLALGALYSYLAQKRLWARGTLFLSTLPIALVTNSIRVFFTALLAYAAEAPVTEEPWHSALGMSVF
ncbi:MAG: exosortase/archaeosortase family protein, partial [Candidatus Zixiibacteriota bacterium]